jgi:hypothetical protein
MLNIREKGKDPRGSSTIEYILGVAAVISVLLVFLRPGGHFSNVFTSTLNSVSDGMELSAARMEGSRPLIPISGIRREEPPEDPFPPGK